MKTQSNTGIIIQARLSSQRCPKKMARPFGGTTLLDLAIQKLVNSKIPNNNIWVSVYEKELIEICKKYPINIFYRSEKSALSEGTPLTEIFEWWNQIPHEYIVMVNGCTPFLTTKTIEDFYFSYLTSKENGMFGVVEKRNYFWNEKNELISTIKGDSMNTKMVPVTKEAAHCLYAGSLRDIGKNVWMGDFSNPDSVNLFSIKEEETLDIDYEWQFSLYEKLYLLQKGEN